MLAVIYIVANIFASLVLLLTMLGSIHTRKITIDAAAIASMAVSYVFIGICVALSIMHPLLFLIYGGGVAGTMLLFLRPDKEEFLLGALTTLAGFVFWPEMVALVIFNRLFTPKADESRD
jgi:hypothetical protein